MVRISVCVLVFVLISFIAAAKPPKKEEGSFIANTQPAPSGAVREVPAEALPLWQAKWWGQKPKTTQVLQCGAGTTVAFAVPSTMPKGWNQKRLYKWLADLVGRGMYAPDADQPFSWALARPALAPRQVTVYCLPPEVVTGADNPVFTWSFGTQMAYTDAATDGGPRALGLEFWVAIQLRLWLDWLHFRMEFSPGYTWGIDGEEASSFSLSEFPAVEFRVADWVWVILGVRHRVAFNAEGDNFNALLVEVGGRFRVWKGLDIGLAFNLGGAWFPVYETVDPASLPYWVEIQPPVVQAASGFTGGATLTVGWQF